MEVDSVEGKTFDIVGNVIVDSGKNPNIIWIIFLAMIIKLHVVEDRIIFKMALLN